MYARLLFIPLFYIISIILLYLLFALQCEKFKSMFEKKDRRKTHEEKCLHYSVFYIFIDFKKVHATRGHI